VKEFHKKDKRQPFTLKEMKIKEKLLRAIYRSESAYLEYKKQQLFFQALRIYKANKAVYELLEYYLLECPNEHINDVCNYIYHLDDWLTQFEDCKKEMQSPTDVFVFERWQGGVPFPKDFVLILKK